VTISDFLLEEDMSSNVVSKRPARPLVLVCRLDEKKEKSDVCLLLLTEKSSKIHPVCLLFFVHVVVVGVGVGVGVALEHELYRHSASKDEEVLALALVLCASQRA
jgi:hypothetical protein